VSLEIGVNGLTTDGHGRPDEQPENKTLSAYFCWRDIKVPHRAGFNWWEAWGPVYLGGTGRLQQLYD